MITLITGWPSTGKTTMAEKWPSLPLTNVIHTDDFIPLGWSESSLAACNVLETYVNARTEGHDADLLMEGIIVPRALRKFLDRNPGKKPCDKLIILLGSLEDLSPGAISIGKGHDTVLDKIRSDLVQLGVEIIETPTDTLL